MEQRGHVIVLDRPRARVVHPGAEAGRSEIAIPCAPGVADVDPPPADAPPVGVGSLLRGPGLAVLAAVSLIEGYRWLGVLHVGSTAAGSLVFGTAGVALVALLTPVAAAVLSSGRRAPGLPARLDPLVVAVAVAVVVATITALVVGGHVSHLVAGATDVLLAAMVLAAVVVAEHARNLRHRVDDFGQADGEQAVHGAP